MFVRVLTAAVLVAQLAGCASPKLILRSTTTGGDAHPKAAVGPTGQINLAGLNVGDTVVYSPGSMRAVVPSPTVSITLLEDASVAQAEAKKALTMNRREGAKIEVMKGRLLKGDFFVQNIAIDMSDTDPKKYEVDLVLLAFNRGDKDFRGDLTVYDLLPPELQYKGADGAAKYNDRRGTKGFLSAIPIVGLISLGMDNFSRSSEAVDMQHESLGDVHKYTFRRLVLEPGQAIGFTIRLKYVPPTAEELIDLRSDARPVVVQQ